MLHTTLIGGSPLKLSVEDRTFNLTAFFLSITLLVGLIWDLFLGLTGGFSIFLLGVFFFYACLYYVSRFLNLVNLSRRIVFASVFVVLPIVWRYNQGMVGTTGFYFYTFVLLMLTSLKHKRVRAGLSLIGYVILLAFAERLVPNFVLPFKKTELIFWDFFFAFVTTSVVFVYGAIYLKDNFDRERDFALSQKNELENQRDHLKQLIQDTEKQNETMQDQKRELEESNSINNKLFSIISHDLRSPLANLETLLQVIAYSDPTPEESKQLMNNLQKDIQNTSALLENILSWSKKQREGEYYSPNSFFLTELVNENMILIQNQAQVKGIELKNEIADDLQVFADSDMVRLVLRNLLSNAIKFCRKGDTISVMSEMNDKSIQVSVCDTGVGISEKNQMKVFNTFDYTERGTANEKGSGLGLFLCRDFIKINGGRIWFKSKPGKGTCFYFTLPLYHI